MILDIKPDEIREAGSVHRAYLEAYNYHALYFAEASNGYQYTVTFNPITLGEFLPNKKVSEFLVEAEDAMRREYEFWKKGAETGKHPKFRRTLYDDNGNNIGWEPEALDKHRIPLWAEKAELYKERLGKVKWIKVA